MDFRQRTICMLLLCAAGPAFAGIPANYWNSADTSSPAALRASLNAIIKAGHNPVGYSGAWNALKIVDEDPGNSANVRLMYTNQSRAKSSSCHVSGCEDGSATTGLWTREHIFPQSTFDSDEPHMSDLHALFPVDQDVNAARSDKPFATVTSPTYTAGGSEGDSNNWEPRPDMRGDVARALFYMDVRYEGDDTLFDLTLTNSTPGGPDSGEMGYLNTLLQWHIDDPVDTYEINRNDKVYDQQFNGNPFVDHPEWVAIVYNVAPPTNGNTVTVSTLDRAAATASAGNGAPMMSISLQANANEWDLGSLAFTQLGTLGDAGFSSIALYRDADANGVVGGGDTLVGTAPMSGGAATMTLSPAARVNATASSFLVVAQLASGATAGQTVQLRLEANSITHSASGGTDVNPAHAAFTSGTSTVSAVSGLFFSEYVEGSSNNKALEIYNSTNAAVNFGVTPYSVVIYFNGSGTPSTPITLTGTVAAGGTYVLANNASVAGLLSLAQQTSGSVTFNGDDCVVLRDPSNNAVDIIGQIGFDPGTLWGTVPIQTAEYSLRRSPRITSGDTDGGNAFEPADEWTSAPQNDFSNVGTHTIDRAPEQGAISIVSLQEDDAGDVTVAFTDAEDGAAGAYSASTSALSSGSFGAAVVTKTGTGAYLATIPYTPAGDYFGNPTFTLTITDPAGGVNFAGLSFPVASVNDLPTLSNPGNQTISENGNTGPLAITVGDVETAAGSLTLFAGASSNETLLPLGNIAFGGSGSARNVTLTPAAGQTGFSDVTISVEDGDGDVTDVTFRLTVNPGAGVTDWSVME